MLAHTLRGTGDRNLVMLHGFLGSGRNLGALTRRWSSADPTLRLVQVDLLGHGRSPTLPPDASLTTMGDAVVNLLNQLDIQTPVSIVGHSLGGRVALALKKAHPDRVRSIALLDIAPGPTTQIQSTKEIVAALTSAPAKGPNREPFAQHLKAAGLSKGMVDWLLMNLDRTEDGFTWRIDRNALAAFGAKTAFEDLWPVVQAHGSSMWCLYGDRSAYVSEEDRGRMQQAGVQVEAVSGAGHFVHVDATEAVQEHLKIWLKLGSATA